MEQSLAFKLCGACKAKLGLDVLAMRTDGLGRQAKLGSNCCDRTRMRVRGQARRH
jgi:hypothetical protein